MALSRPVVNKLRKTHDGMAYRPGLAATAQGFFMTSGGYEYNLVLGVAALTLAFVGPGVFSVDAVLELPLSGLAWGALALLVAASGGAFQLVQRHTAPSGEPANA